MLEDYASGEAAAAAAKAEAPTSAKGGKTPPPAAPVDVESLLPVSRCCMHACLPACLPGNKGNRTHMVSFKPGRRRHASQRSWPIGLMCCVHDIPSHSLYVGKNQWHLSYEMLYCPLMGGLKIYIYRERER